MGKIKERVEALLEGTSEIDAAILKFVAYVQDKINAKYKKDYPTQTVPMLTIEKGKKYARIVKVGVGKDAYGFVDMTNGDLLKSASWKAPAKGVRGSALDSSTWDGAAGPYSLGGSIKWESVESRLASLITDEPT